MIIVKKTSSLSLVLFCLIFISSCKRTTKNIKKNNNNSTLDTIVYNYSNIETNSHKKGFDRRLIHTLPVKENDTILFRKITHSRNNKISISNEISNFKIEGANDVNYYKTGTNKFSIYPIRLKKLKEKRTTIFYTYSNHDKSKNPYNPNNMSSSVDIQKINDTLIKFDINADFYDEFDIYLTVENETLSIVKIYIHDHTSDSKELYYELDTLIKYNKFIDLRKLRDVTEKKKNLKKN